MKIKVPFQVSTHLINPRYREDIDGLRAIAVLCVVGFHAFPSWFRGGFVGVDIFFVISGFLITTIIVGSLERNSFSFSEFYGRRIKRIFPALILLLLFSLVAGWFLLDPGEYKGLGKHITASAGFLLNFLLWKERGYFDAAAEAKPLLHLWSLSIEEQFYIFWPFFLWIVRRCRLNFFWVLIMAGIVSFLFNLKLAAMDPVGAFYLPQARFWELLVGGVLACVFVYPKVTGFQGLCCFLCQFKLAATCHKILSKWEKEFRNACSFIGLFLIGISIVLVKKTTIFPGWWGLLPTMGSFLIISSGSEAWFNKRVLSHFLLVWIGLVSYPLYLWHWTLLVFVKILQKGILLPSFQLGIILISILLAGLTYWLVERPIRFGKPRKAIIFLLLALMLVLGILGHVCLRSDGFWNRFSQNERIFFHSAKSDSEAICLHTCFLDLERGQVYSDFSACPSRPGDEKKPPLFLWGDSQAAQLYPGYQAWYGEKFNIIQRTTAGCPPISDFGRTECREINQRLFDFIKEIRPIKVVLAARWDSFNYELISKTIDKLRAVGVNQIDLVGPVPHWGESLPKLLRNQYKTDIARKIRKKIPLNPDASMFQLDKKLSVLSQRLKINYHSPLSILCDAEGCITGLGESFNAPISWDPIHLTTEGAKLLVSRIKLKEKKSESAAFQSGS